MAKMLKIGDTVQLKSGGPTMTIEWIGAGNGGKMVATCVWFNVAKYDSHTFDIDLLASVAVPASE